MKKDDSGWSFSSGDSAAGSGSSRKAGRLPEKDKVIRLSQADMDYIVARYDASLSYADEFIGELAGWVREFSPDNTIMIVMADHGEGVGDHGGILHCTDPPRLYQELIHVPLAIYIPPKWMKTGVAVVRQPVELIDLMPTILDLVQASGPLSGMQGKSLVGVIKGEKKEEADRPVFAETLGYGVHVRSVKSGAWKLIRAESQYGVAPKIELYDLTSDPSEAHDLAPQKPEVVRGLLDRLSAWGNGNEK